VVPAVELLSDAMIRRVVIGETEVGLLYRQGRFDRLLEPGGRWVLGTRVNVARVDTRRRLLVVSSQDVLTRDNVQLRLSAVVAFSVADAPRALHEFQSYEQELHVAAQLALRAIVAEAEVDELLERRNMLGERLTELVRGRSGELGLEVAEVELRDVTLPGSLRTAFAEVLHARAEGRASLERARGESAALRSLANAARVLDGNPALMNLRVLQTIGQESALPGTTRFVVNLADTLVSTGRAEPGDAAAEADAP
jgi:regulator of protease activity HflC (stomatin/prohibitin superfamily)